MKEYLLLTCIDFPKVGRQVAGVEGAFYEACSKTVLPSFLLVCMLLQITLSDHCLSDHYATSGIAGAFYEAGSKTVL